MAENSYGWWFLPQDFNWLQPPQQQNMSPRPSIFPQGFFSRQSQPQNMSPAPVPGSPEYFGIVPTPTPAPAPTSAAAPALGGGAVPPATATTPTGSTGYVPNLSFDGLNSQLQRPEGFGATSGGAEVPWFWDEGKYQAMLDRNKPSMVLPAINLGLQGVNTLGNLVMGGMALYDARKAFNFQKQMAEKNYNAARKSYNNAVEDRIRGATSSAYTTDEEQRKIDQAVRNRQQK